MHGEAIFACATLSNLLYEVRVRSEYDNHQLDLTIPTFNSTYEGITYVEGELAPMSTVHLLLW